MNSIPGALLQLGRINGDSCDVTLATRANLSVPPHRHDTHNYVQVCSGVLYLTLDGTERAIGAGQWCDIPAGALHAERFAEETTVIVFWKKEAAA
ncbi:cupin domain-containing protein [Vogesella fluminis]|uniref:Cupin type-2 domain-containing protein n=1 Tax=Vogesella fluminis TaxID=1069161 RepID=A0ABQ3H9X8_9NEIS|nr:cupin domain-containing protein [Vogesella fluminis]GHD78193.1 hypothetical protein GCM10011419_19910 [Vogesella fluminis]